MKIPEGVELSGGSRYTPHVQLYQKLFSNGSKSRKLMCLNSSCIVNATIVIKGVKNSNGIYDIHKNRFAKNLYHQSSSVNLFGYFYLLNLQETQYIPTYLP